MLQDLRVAWRSLWRSPAFTLTVVLTLALGIGVTSVVFSVVDAALLRPLPYRDARRIVLVFERRQMNPSQFADPSRLTGTRDWMLSNRDLPRYQRENRSFTALGGYTRREVSLTGGGDPERLRAGLVTPEVFDILGVRPVAGRNFTPEEDRFGNNAVAVLSYRLWQRRFGGSAAAVGGKLTIDGAPHTIVGVLPPGRIVLPGGLTDESEIWLPCSHQMSARQPFAIFTTVGRLKPGVSIEQAAADLSAVATRGPAPRSGRIVGARVAPVLAELTGETRPALLILLAAVGCVLLVGCANIANLLLARNGARRAEFAVRAALGAGRAQLARHTLAECAWLAALGAVAGLAAGRIALRAILLWVPAGTIPRIDEVSMDWRVVLFGAAASVAAALVFGVPAALLSAPAEVYETLKQGAPGGGGSRRRAWTRRSMVVAEIAIAVVLVVGAGLLTRSFLRLRGIDLGIHQDSVSTISMMLPDYRYRDAPQRSAFVEQVLGRLRGAPGVEYAAATNFVPMVRGWTTSQGIELEGRNDDVSVYYRAVTPDYFRAMGVALRRGRLFTDRDVDAVIVNEAMSRRLWPGGDPLGKRIRWRKTWTEIVGVVADVKHDGPATDTQAEMYVPFAQNSFASVSFVARARVDAAPLLRASVKAVDATFPLGEVKTMDEIVADSIATPRFYLRLMALFAGLAAALAAVGIYGLIAYSVVQRAHEIGVRLAVGASRGAVFRMMLREGLALGLAGALAGLAGAVAATRALKSLLFGVTATDPATFAGVAAVFVAVAALASCIPAWRTGRIDPVVTLRAE